MHYIVFGLGILLAGAGCLSIYAGYDIVEIERGWTEVIAGTTLFTGGVVTIALATILRGLKSLSDLYSAAQPLTVPDSVSVKAPALALNPVSMPVANMQFGQTEDSLPENPRSQDLHIQDVRAEDLRIEDRQQAEFHPDGTPAFSHAEGISTAPAVQQPEVSYEPEPVLPDHAMTTPTSQPTSSALSLDDMWKRVSNAMAKPIFASRSDEPAVDPTIPEPIPAAPTHALEVAVDEPSSPAPEFDFEPLAGPVENPLESSHTERHEALNITAAFLLSEPEPTAPEAEAAEAFAPIAQGDESAPEPSRAVPEASGPAALDLEPAGPAMIGRYEAEGTSYLMFSDGSIEAQSESGIFHFASMADLKAFIEDKQAAVT